MSRVSMRKEQITDRRDGVHQGATAGKLAAQISYVEIGQPQLKQVRLTSIKVRTFTANQIFWKGFELSRVSSNPIIHAGTMLMRGCFPKLLAF